MSDKTEKQVFIEMLTRAGVPFRDVPNESLMQDLVRVENKDNGYSGFFSDWVFSRENGSLLDVSHWES